MDAAEKNPAVYGAANKGDNVSEFKTPLVVRLLPEGGDPQWQLDAPLVYTSDAMGCDVIVPAGFITDFVSFGPLKNVGHRAAVIHDWLYSCADVPQQVADQVLREALETVGVETLLAEAMYAAVELCGAGHRDNKYQFYQKGDSHAQL